MTAKDLDIIAIGGSAGSIPVLIRLIASLPEHFMIPIVIVVHRMKNVDSGLDKMLSATQKIYEPEDKEMVLPGSIYLAPQNYHLLVEEDRSFGLDYAETVNFCRPSIDVTFTSIAAVYQQRALGILLSGANRDGAAGLSDLLKKGGTGIVQDPRSAESPAMPEAAIRMNRNVIVYTPEEICKTIIELF